MKANKKKILVSALAFGTAAALVTGGTIAYFSDHKEATNSFTVGNVKISVYESQLHRQNSGRAGAFTALPDDSTYCDWTYTQTQPGINYNNNKMESYDDAVYCTPNMDAFQYDGISAVANGHTVSKANGGPQTRDWGYSDATIIEDARNYKTEGGYFDIVSKDLVPGKWVRKFTYVKNDGDNDAYVRIRYVVPEELVSKLTLKIPGTPYNENDTDKLPYMTAVNEDGTAYVGNIKSYTGYTRTLADGTKERVYEAVINEALKPSEMSFWSPVNAFQIAKTVTEMPENFDIKVEADAIQAWGFDSAIDAFKEF